MTIRDCVAKFWSEPSKGHTENARCNDSSEPSSRHRADAPLPTDPGMPAFANNVRALVRRSISRRSCTPCWRAASMYEFNPPIPAGTEKKGRSMRHSAAVVVLSKYVASGATRFTKARKSVASFHSSFAAARYDAGTPSGTSKVTSALVPNDSAVSKTDAKLQEPDCKRRTIRAPTSAEYTARREGSFAQSAHKITSNGNVACIRLSLRERRTAASDLLFVRVTSSPTSQSSISSRTRAP